VDLLMAVDWDGLIQPTLEKETTLPPLAGLTGFGAADTAASEAAAAATPSNPTAGNDAALATSTEAPQEMPAAPAATTKEQPVAALTTVETGHSTPAAPVASAVPAGSDFGRNALLIIVALGLVVLVASLLMRGTQA
jgi:hypothetical protein